MARKVKVGTKVTLKPKKSGQKPISFRAGGLHKSLGVPQGQKIPQEKINAAVRGEYGPLAKKQALLKANVLTGRKKSL